MHEEWPLTLPLALGLTPVCVGRCVAAGGVVDAGDAKSTTTLTRAPRPEPVGVAVGARPV